jgi:hypothetical protein
MAVTLEVKPVVEVKSSYLEVHKLLEDSLFHEAIEKIRSIPVQERFRWSAAKLPRDTLEFGMVYRELEEGRTVVHPMPECIVNIRKILHARFQDKISEGLRPEEFDNCIVSIYEAGDGMAPHVDRSQAIARDGKERNYYFGDSIFGLILVPDTKERLYFINPENNEKIFLNEEKGMAFLFQGQLRQKWKHGLDPVETSRISLTFRKVNFKKS